MPNIKRYLIIFILILLITLLGTACSSSTNDKKTDDNNSTNTSVTPDPSQIEQGKKNDAMKKTDRNDFTYDLGKEENNQSNINRGGLVARYDNSYYYTDPKIGILYRVNVDGSDRIKFDNEINVENINIVDGWIYYTVNSYNWVDGKTAKKRLLKESAKIYKKSIDGDQKIACNFYASKMICDSQYVYFTNLKDSNRLYRCDLSFAKPTKISEDVDVINFYVDGDTIFYLTSKGIYKLKSDGTSNQQFDDGIDIQRFYINNGWMYFQTKEKGYVYTIPIDKHTGRKLLLDQVSDYFVSGDYIYYIKLDEPTLFKANLQNISVTAKKYIESISNFTIIGNVLFTSAQEENNFKFLGYSEKIRLDNGLKKPMANDIVDIKIGIDDVQIADHVSRYVEIEDRNAILSSMSQNLNDFFIGNSALIYSNIFDMNDDRLNELFMIYKQVITQTSTIISGIKKLSGDIQIVMTVYKWEGSKLTNLGSYPLKNDDLLSKGKVLKPKIGLIGFENENSKKIVVDMGSNQIDLLELFRINQNYIEATDTTPYNKQLLKMGYNSY